MNQRLLPIFGIITGILICAGAAPAQVKTISIHPGKFISASFKAEQLELIPVDAGAFLCRSNTATENFFFSPLELPDGEVIKWVKLHYIDNEAVRDLSLHLARANKYTGDIESIFQVNSSGASSDIRSSVVSTCTPPALRRVVNAACTYYLALFFDGATGKNMVVHGITIGY